MFAMYPGTTPDEIRAAITRSITDSMFLYGSIRDADFESAVGEPVYVSRLCACLPADWAFCTAPMARTSAVT